MIIKVGDLVWVHNKVQARVLSVGPDSIETTEGTYPNKNIWPVQNKIVTGADFYRRGLRPLQDLFSRLKMDLREHGINNNRTPAEDILKYFISDMDYSKESLSDANLQSLLDGTATWIPVQRMGSDRERSRFWCDFCNQYLSFETDGRTLRTTDQCLELEVKSETLQLQLNVPSGVLVVSPFLEKLFPTCDHEENAHMAHMARKTSQAYAKIGLVYVQMSANDSTIIQYNNKDTYTFSGGRKNLDLINKIMCLNLTMCDSDEFLRRCSYFGASPAGFQAVEIRVEPGVYAYTHHDQSQRPWGTLVRKSAPEEVVDYLSSWKNLQITPTQAAVSFFKKNRGHIPGVEITDEWSDLDEEQKSWAYYYVVSRLFQPLDNMSYKKIPWHNNGFPVFGIPDPDVIEEPLPSFRKRMQWHLFYKPVCDSTITPEFAGLAMRALESLLTFGTGGRDAKDSMKRAIYLMRNLVKKFPEQADPEYAQWINEPLVAEQWVKKFPLVGTKSYR